MNLRGFRQKLVAQRCAIVKFGCLGIARHDRTGYQGEGGLGGQLPAKMAGGPLQLLAGLAQEATIASAKSSTTLARGGLPGAGNWSHQYGNVGNTAVIDEKRVKGDLGVLWFGDPGPGDNNITSALFTFE